MEISKELQIVIDIIKKAGDILLEYYKKDYPVFEKDNKTPVTEADFSSEKFICEELRKNFDYPILSEETVNDKNRLQSEFVWIVDPLDGTKDFISGSGEFTVVIGLSRKQTPFLGAVYRPTTKELYFAETGNGAYLQKYNNEPIRLSVSNVNIFTESKIVSSHFNDEFEKVIEQINPKSKTRVGSVALKACLIAEGKFDAYFYFGSRMSEWDTCASEVIVKEAGGNISDLFGKQRLYNQSDTVRRNGVIISNGLLHDKLIDKFLI
ncbi:MAG: inositol monophosphatase [Parcubacteria group bacterium Athens0714_16]|nr:MAG: inositol monophosphatase [Parcubacteria group bacterium Athens0714_16]